MFSRQPGSPSDQLGWRSVWGWFMRKLVQVKKLTAEAQSTDNLRAFILSGGVRPGARLKEMPLAAELGVARATLRTSLMRLRDEGIVTQIPFTGWQVVDLTPTDVWEIWTLRGSLESLAAKIVAERMTPEIEEEIERAYAALRSACTEKSVEAVNDADFALHRVIIESSSHARLQAQYLQVEQQVRLLIATSNHLVAEKLDEIAVQHEGIINALVARNGKLAADEAWNHNEVEGGKLVSSLRRQKD